MALIDIARRIKAGACFLDKKIPNWRTVLRRHEDNFDFADGDCCILGTLEHYSGRMRTLKQRIEAEDDDTTFGIATKALRLNDERIESLGFDFPEDDMSDMDDEGMREAFDALWRAEFGKPCQ